jgi:flagellar basal-body rod protein FlgB
MASFIDNLISQTSVPALAQLMQFTAARHELLVNNIANFDTPGYRVEDLSVTDFQQALAKALDQGPGRTGSLQLSGRQVHTDGSGHLSVRPEPVEQYNVVYQDQANRHVEKEMAALAENTLTYNIAAELLKAQFVQLKTAIRQKL